MSHGLTFAKWIDASSAEAKYKELNKLCLQVYHDYLFKVVHGNSSFDKARHYFSQLDKPLLERADTSKEVLDVFHALKDAVKNVNLEKGTVLTYFPKKESKTVRIEPEDWNQERTTALCQYARFICGLDSSEAVQADHIRQVYSIDIIRARVAGEPYTINEQHDNLVILAYKSGYITESLTNEKAVAQFGITEISQSKGKSVLHF